MNEIDKKLSEIDFSDLGLKGHGSELDKDDEDEGFKQERMFMQLGKIVDSRGNPKPLDSVKTDDGKTIMCKSSTAKKIMDMERSITQQGGKKEKFMNMIQKSDGLNKVIDYIENK